MRQNDNEEAEVKAEHTTYRDARMHQIRRKKQKEGAGAERRSRSGMIKKQKQKWKKNAG